MISLIPWNKVAGLLLVVAVALTLVAGWQRKEIRALKAESLVNVVMWQSRFDALNAQLADAKTAGAEAVKAKEQADAEAAKRLAAERKKWKELYAKDPEARAWADSPVPAGVLDRLRD